MTGEAAVQMRAEWVGGLEQLGDQPKRLNLPERLLPQGSQGGERDYPQLHHTDGELLVIKPFTKHFFSI